MIATSILKAGDEGYESNLHSCIESENIEIIELPSVKTKKSKYSLEVNSVSKSFYNNFFFKTEEN